MPLRVGVSLLSSTAETFTGTGTYVRGLLEAFARRPGDVQVRVLHLDRDAGDLADLAGPNVTLQPAARSARGSRLGRVAALAGDLTRAGRDGARLAQDVDVVHYPLTLPVPMIRTRPTVMTLHDLQHHGLPEYFSRAERAWRAISYDLSARRVTAVVTDSEFSRRDIAERLGVPDDRLRAIPLAVDHERFHPGPVARDAEVLARLALPSEGRLVFFPASLWPHKNHATLLEALAHLDRPDVHLVLTGAAFGRTDELLASAAAHGLAGRVHHLGSVPAEAMPALYRRVDALVFPSRYEGFGFPPLEAMACGCPVASTRGSSLTELIGEDHVLLDAYDARQMATGIARILDDAPLRARLREAGRRRAARHTWDGVADAHLRAYEDALARWPGKRRVPSDVRGMVRR